jgi:hypothetical protein
MFGPTFLVDARVLKTSSGLDVALEGSNLVVLTATTWEEDLWALWVVKHLTSQMFLCALLMRIFALQLFSHPDDKRDRFCIRNPIKLLANVMLVHLVPVMFQILQRKANCCSMTSSIRHGP